MLVGRSAECATLERLVADARQGRSGVLLLHGEPGIGKSALLDHTIKHAQDFTVVSARGVESEAQLAFAGLADLTRPLLGHLPGLPKVQAAALKAALALGPPVGGDRFTIAVATLTLFAAAAEQRPLLVMVDDAHWLDGPSAEVVGFVARRLHAEGIVLLLAMRDGEPSAMDVTGLAQLRVQGLDPVGAETLLRQQTATLLAAQVTTRLVRVTAGNPLALLELPTLLSAEQLTGTVPLQEPLPAGDSIQQAFLRQVARLPAATQTGLLVAAASDTSDLATIVGAAEQLGVDTTALEPAETARLIRLRGRGLEFRHPLLRAAVYHGATPPARRATHRALATILHEVGDADRAAWQLAAATLTPDEQVAQALEQTGRRARDRGGYAAAAHALDRAAQLTPDPQQRAHRLHTAAEAFWFAGHLDPAIHTLDRALPLTADPRQRADLQHLRGHIEQWLGGDVLAAHQLLVTEADRIAPMDPERAARLLASAVLPCLAAGKIPTALTTARRACALADHASRTAQAHAKVALGLALINHGQANEGYTQLVSARLVLDRVPIRDPSSYTAILFANHVSVWLEDWAPAIGYFDHVINLARAQSAPGMLLPIHLAMRSERMSRSPWNFGGGPG